MCPIFIGLYCFSEEATFRGIGRDIDFPVVTARARR
jgi:hypothetical protein